MRSGEWLIWRYWIKKIALKKIAKLHLEAEPDVAMLVSCDPSPSWGRLLVHVTPLGESEKGVCPGQRQPCRDP